MSHISKLYFDKKIVIDRNQAKLFARALPAKQLHDFPSESYRVDLNIPKFEWLYEGKCTSWGSCQVIGSWASDETWLWGWENNSISVIGTSLIKDAVLKLYAIAEFTTQRIFTVSYQEAYQLAAWIAYQTGWLGVYPSPTQEGGVAFLALKLTAIQGHSEEPKDNSWCLCCGCYPSQVRKFIALGDGQGICDGCIENAADMLIPQDPSRECILTCCLCRENNSGVTFPFIHICGECINLAKKIISEDQK